MCGIAGVVQFGRDGSVSRPLLERMGEAIVHRGPDEHGTWIGSRAGLTTRRLRVVDLVGGRQPIANEDGLLHLVANGEVYNADERRDELRRAGHVFSTRTDVEVILHAYETDGLACVDALEGMFAFALWDERLQRLLIARDRFGEKPLYYAALPTTFLFASELKALLMHPDVPRELDWTAVAQYLTHEYVPSPRAIFRAVRKLPPAHWMTVDANGSVRTERYWSPPMPDRDGPPAREAAGEVLSLLGASVRRQTSCDVPWGAFLSGGLDSSLVTALAVPASSTPIKTFAIGFEDPSYDETRHASRVARWLGTEHHDVVLRGREAPGLVAEAARVFDEPFADATILPALLLSRFAREHVTVALTGDGGDELFCGYPTQTAHLVADVYERAPLLMRRLLAAAAEHLPTSHRYLSFDFALRRFLRDAGRPGPERHLRWMGSFAPETLRALLTPEAWERVTIERLTPIQIATFDLDEYRRVRREFTADEWLDLIVRSMGYEPAPMSRRLKLLFVLRLVPLAERNYNLVELGPRGTGKSYVVQEVSPYAALLTGGTTIANLFGHMTGRQKGMVQIWDVVGFDEVADLQKMPKEVVTTMKTYCESGTFQRGQEPVSGDASISMFGNTNQPVDVMVQTGHLFAPMPDVIREDMAFIDRLHMYLPGWEIPKMQNSMFTDHYGFVVDYLAEALRELRKHNFTELIDREFALGPHLNARDRKAVRKTVSGLIKVLHPDGELTRDELAELLELALEGRRRVKEQLKKMGSFEYYQTSFSYTVQETGEERFVGVPEQGGRDLISADPLAPGTVYTSGVASDGTVGLYRLEVSVSAGTGKLKLAGGVSGAMKESISRAFGYLQGKKVELGVGRDLDTSEVHVEVVDLIGNHVEAEVGVAFFVAVYSALRKAAVSPALLVLGDMSIQGNIKPMRSLTEPLQLAKDNGAHRALVPIENKRNFLDVPADIVEQVDPIFYGDPKTAAMKVLG